jgi:hypothetical protein
MIPITEHTITAVAALIYNEAYEQDPDTGWLAGDENSAPGHADSWLEWAKRLLEVMQEQPTASDKQIIETAKQRVDVREVGGDWNTIPMDQDNYSTITHETDIQMPIVHNFLEHPSGYTEVAFLERDPAYLAYLELPL